MDYLPFASFGELLARILSICARTLATLTTLGLFTPENMNRG